jgi:Pvc16 N-terminal domain
VIHEVDDVLRSWVLEEILAGTEVEVAFDAPTSEWAARRNAPTVNLFLYDIREDLARRYRGLIAEHDAQGVVVARHDPPRWFKLSYLATAWTNRPQDEHRLLSALLAGFLRREVLPSDRLAGSLAELGLPVPVTVALPPGEDRALADVWSALGGELKASLDLVVSAPMALVGIAAGPPVHDGMVVRVADRAVLDRDHQGATSAAETRQLRYVDPDVVPQHGDARPVGVPRRRTGPGDRRGRG